MHRLQIALLRHDTRAGSHFDLLVEDPTAGHPATAPLWAARLTVLPEAWAPHRALHLTPLPPHRRHYLTYEGALTRGRGQVRRVHTGHAVPRLWTPSRIALDAHLGPFEGRLDLRRQSPVLWCGVATPAGQARIPLGPRPRGR